MLKPLGYKVPLAEMERGGLTQTSKLCNTKPEVHKAGLGSIGNPSECQEESQKTLHDDSKLTPGRCRAHPELCAPLLGIPNIPELHIPQRGSQGALRGLWKILGKQQVPLERGCGGISMPPDRCWLLRRGCSGLSGFSCRQELIPRSQ